METMYILNPGLARQPANARRASREEQRARMSGGGERSFPACWPRVALVAIVPGRQLLLLTRKAEQASGKLTKWQSASRSRRLLCSGEKPPGSGKAIDLLRNNDTRDKKKKEIGRM